MPADISTPADRVAFVRAVEGGPITFGTSMANVANCALIMPPGAASLIGLTHPATYAAAAALISQRLAAGSAPF